MTSEEPRKMQMTVVSTQSNGGEFTFDMHARSNTARTVRFALEQADAIALYEALAHFLKK